MKLLRETTSMHFDLGQRVEFVHLKAFGMATYGVEVAQLGLTSAATDFFLPKAVWCRPTTLSLLFYIDVESACAQANHREGPESCR